MLMYCLFRDGVTANCTKEDKKAGLISKLRSDPTLDISDYYNDFIVFLANKEFHFIKS